MYHSQSRPSPHSICPWVTWLLICCIDLISKVLFKCSITPRQPWSVSSFCLESGWIANVSSVAVAKHLATEAGPCRLVIGALKREKSRLFFCSFLLAAETCIHAPLIRQKLLEKKLPPQASISGEIQIDGDCIRSEILMSNHSFNGNINVKRKEVV